MKELQIWLQDVKPPWLGLVEETEKDNRWLPSVQYSLPDINLIIRELRGHRMRTVTSLMNEFAAALQFFRGFGGNWYALNECLCYLDEWLPGDAYLLIIDDPQEVLIDENINEFQWLVVTLQEVGEWWSKPITNNDRYNRAPIPFHILFQCPSVLYTVVKDRLTGVIGEANLKFF